MVICSIISNKQYNMYIVLVVKSKKLNYVKILLTCMLSIYFSITFPVTRLNSFELSELKQ